MSRRSTRLNPAQEFTNSPDLDQSQATSTSTGLFNLIQTSTPLTAIPSSTNTTLTLLMHSTNAFGTWGAGFAKALQTRYPSAELIYKSWCDEKRPTSDQWPSKDLVGRCLVVDPQDEDQDSSSKGASGNAVAIACLFTSYGYGGRPVKSGKGGGHAAKDGVKKVVESTKTALEELRGWITKIEEGTEGIGKDGKKREVVVYSPKFNSGNFGVDWEDTKAMIMEAFADWEGEWRILANR